MKKNVGVIFGGRSVEHEVSVITALQIMEQIDKSRYEVIPIYINKEGRWFTGEELKKYKNFKEKNFKSLKEIILTSVHNDNKLYSHPKKLGIFSKKVIDSIDIAFPAIHGTNGEDGTLQGLLELLNIPYVGCGVLASSVGMDKIVMKSVFKSYDLPIVEYYWFYRRKWNQSKEKVIRDIENKLQYPLFIKPSNLGSSIGITKANNKDELIDSIEVAIRYDKKILVEKAVEKPREINCAVMGYEDNVKTSLCEEPLGWKDLLSYDDKYVNNSSKRGKGEKRVIPADIPEDIKNQIEEIAKKSFIAIDGEGNARIDFLLDANNNIYINEINTLPGSIAFYLWEPMGISFKEVVNEMIDIALRKKKDKDRNMYSYDVDLFSKRDGLGEINK